MNTIEAHNGAASSLVAVNADARLRLAQSLGRRVDSSDPAVRAQAASRLTSELFFKPILAEMRKFPFGREMLTDGWAGSAFDERLDERLAGAGSGASAGLINRIAGDLNPAGARAQKSPAAVGLPAATVFWPFTQAQAADTGAQQ